MLLATVVRLEPIETASPSFADCTDMSAKPSPLESNAPMVDAVGVGVGYVLGASVHDGPDQVVQVGQRVSRGLGKCKIGDTAQKNDSLYDSVFLDTTIPDLQTRARRKSKLDAEKEGNFTMVTMSCFKYSGNANTPCSAIYAGGAFVGRPYLVS